MKHCCEMMTFHIEQQNLHFDEIHAAYGIIGKVTVYVSPTGVVAESRLIGINFCPFCSTTIQPVSNTPLGPIPIKNPDDQIL